MTLENRLKIYVLDIQNGIANHSNESFIMEELGTLPEISDSFIILKRDDYETGNCEDIQCYDPFEDISFHMVIDQNGGENMRDFSKGLVL